MAGATEGALKVERWKALTLTPGMVLGLFFLQRYRFLTTTQVAKAAGLSFDHTAEVLRGLELRGIVGHFGHVGSVRFRAKWPQVSNFGCAERGTIRCFVAFQRQRRQQNCGDAVGWRER